MMNRLASPDQLRASLLRWALFLVPLVLLLGYGSGAVAGSAANNPWFAQLQKPAIYPPAITFPIVWTILYAMMGLAFAAICSAWGSRGRGVAIAVFIAQFALNLVWSPVFFALHQLELALGILLALDVLVALCVVLFLRIRRWAGLLLVPYLAWVLFATLLSWQLWQLNPDASGIEPATGVQRFEL